MKYKLTIAGLLAGAAMAALPLTPRIASATPPTLTIAADTWCPINCAAADVQQGIGVDLAKAVFEPLGYQVRYVVMPWSRALEQVRKGQVDAVVGANINDDDTLLFPAHPIYYMTDDFYTAADSSLSFKKLDSLMGKHIGIIVDYGYGKEVKEFVARNKKIPGMIQETGGDDALEQNIRKLLAHRIDVLIESRPIMDYNLKKLRLTNAVKLIGEMKQGPVYLAFSPALKQSQERKKLYDDRIEKLEKSGMLARLYASYGLRP